MAERPAIRTVRTRYAGTWFASTLEADWAATFDTWHWYWQYEPLAVRLRGGGSYRADFYLPSQRVWAEVKGPHNERVGKPAELQDTLGYDEWEWATDLVVVLRPPGPGDTACWEGTRDDQDIVLVRCPECEHLAFMDYTGAWLCRRHPRVRKEPNKFWTAPGGALYRSGELPFTRAPRPQQGAA